MRKKPYHDVQIPSAGIELDYEFKLTCTNECWTLTLNRIGEVDEVTGKAPKTFKQWFYPNVVQALQGYINQAVKPAEHVVQLRDLFLKAYANVGKAIQTIKDETKPQPPLRRYERR